MPYIRIDTNAGEVAAWVTWLANRIPNDVLLAGASQLADEALELYGKTYESWQHKPKFYKEVKVKSREVEVVVGTNDQIYTYVDFGTSPHYIAAVDAPMLIYQATYHPATQPLVIGSDAPSYEGPVIKRLWVWHTGAMARRFSVEIQRRINFRAMPVFRGAVLRWLAGAPGRPVMGFVQRIWSTIRRQ